MLSPLRAIKKETLRFHDFNGRTARGDYIWFFLFWNLVMALGLTAILQYSPQSSRLFLNAVLLFGLSAFVAPAGMRRLHDTGQSGEQIFQIFVPTAAFGVIVWLGLQAFYFLVPNGFAAASSAFGETGFLLSMLALLTSFVILPIGIAIGAAIAIFLTLAQTSHTLGQLILPSDPNPNQYGPNPTEVPS